MKFSRENLLYDIANYAYIEMHRYESEGGSPTVGHLRADLTAPGNVDRVARVLALAHANVVDMLHSSLHACAVPADDAIVWPEEYVVAIHAGHGMRAATVNLISQLIHEYMVYQALYDWLSITAPDAAPKWLEKSQSVAAQLSTVYVEHRGAFRRRLPPF